jgi:hypothetical protein
LTKSSAVWATSRQPWSIVITPTARTLVPEDRERLARQLDLNDVKLITPTRVVGKHLG